VRRAGRDEGTSGDRVSNPAMRSVRASLPMPAESPSSSSHVRGRRPSGSRAIGRSRPERRRRVASGSSKGPARRARFGRGRSIGETPDWPVAEPIRGVEPCRLVTGGRLLRRERAIPRSVSRPGRGPEPDAAKSRPGWDRQDSTASKHRRRPQHERPHQCGDGDAIRARTMERQKARGTPGDPPDRHRIREPVPRPEHNRMRRDGREVSLAYCRPTGPQPIGRPLAVIPDTLSPRVPP